MSIFMEACKELQMPPSASLTSSQTLAQSRTEIVSIFYGVKLAVTNTTKSYVVNTLFSSFACVGEFGGGLVWFGLNGI